MRRKGEFLVVLPFEEQRDGESRCASAMGCVLAQRVGAKQRAPLERLVGVVSPRRVCW